MPTTFLNLFSIECLILAIYVFSFNFPIEHIILNKRLYSLLLLIASLTAFIINLCINTRNIISKNLIAVIIMSILLTVLLITLIFKSQILTFDNASIQNSIFLILRQLTQKQMNWLYTTIPQIQNSVPVIPASLQYIFHRLLHRDI